MKKKNIPHMKNGISAYTKWLNSRVAPLPIINYEGGGGLIIPAKYLPIDEKEMEAANRKNAFRIKAMQEEFA